MSYQINQNINPKAQYPQSLTGIGDTSLQAIKADQVKQGINNSTVTKKSDAVGDPVTMGMTVGIWLILSQAMDKFNAACRGEYNTSLLGRIDNGVENMKVVKSDWFKNLLKRSAKTKETFHKYIRKSKILSAMFYTPTEPKFKIAKTMIHGTVGEVSIDGTQLADIITKNGTDEEFITKKLKLKNVKEFNEIKENIHDPVNMKKLQEAYRQPLVKDVVEDVTQAGRKFKDSDSFIAKIVKRFWSRKVGCVEVANKIEALNLSGQAKAGKMVTKAFMRTLEGLTNGTAGGKVAIGMQAYFLADALKKAYHAPKGDKFQTFTEELVSGTAMYLTMPWALNLMHKFGGLKHIGMTDKGALTINKDLGLTQAIENAKKSKNIKDYRKAVELFNETAKTGGFETKAAYKAAKKEIKSVLKVENLTGFKKLAHLIYKPLKLAGSIMSAGLNNFNAFVKPGTRKTAIAWVKSGGTFKKKFGEFFLSPMARLRGAAGFAVRFASFMFVFSPLFGDNAVRLSHLIFGRPKKSILDKEEEPKEEPKNQTPVAPVLPQNNQKPQTINPIITGTNPKENMINMYNTNKLNHATNLNNTTGLSNQNSVINSSTNMINHQKTVQNNQQTQPKAPVRTYVPSPVGVQLENNGKVEVDKMTLAMNKADKAEQDTMKFLSGV